MEKRIINPWEWQNERHYVQAVEVKNVTALQKLSITNTLLHDYNENQVNLIHIKANGKEQDTKLDYPNSDARFTF